MPAATEWRPFWLHQGAEYLVGLVLIASRAAAPDPLCRRSPAGSCSSTRRCPGRRSAPSVVRARPAPPPRPRRDRRPRRRRRPAVRLDRHGVAADDPAGRRRARFRVVEHELRGRGRASADDDAVGAGRRREPRPLRRPSLRQGQRGHPQERDCAAASSSPAEAGAARARGSAERSSSRRYETLPVGLAGVGLAVVVGQRERRRRPTRRRRRWRAGGAAAPTPGRTPRPDPPRSWRRHRPCARREATRTRWRASRIVPTPCVSTWCGTSSTEPKKRALSARVWVVSVLSRVRDASDDPGSLKPMCPSLPIPSSWRSTPPASRIARLVGLARGDQIGGAAVRSVARAPGRSRRAP